MNLVAWILSIIVAVFFVGAGANKLLSPRAKLLQNPRMGWVNDFTGPQVKTIAALEILGGLGVILPWLLDIARILTPFAAAGLALTMIGALVVHARRGELAHAAPVNGILLVFTLSVMIVRLTQF